MIYKPNLHSITEVASLLEKIPYNENYIPKDLLQSIIDSKTHTYILKHLGAGFTYGCFNLKGNIVIIVPNIQIVKDKKHYEMNLIVKTLFSFMVGLVTQ